MAQGAIYNPIVNQTPAGLPQYPGVQPSMIPSMGIAGMMQPGNISPIHDFVRQNPGATPQLLNVVFGLGPQQAQQVIQDVHGPQQAPMGAPPQTPTISMPTGGPGAMPDPSDHGQSAIYQSFARSTRQPQQGPRQPGAFQRNGGWAGLLTPLALLLASRGHGPAVAGAALGGYEQGQERNQENALQQAATARQQQQQDFENTTRVQQLNQEAKSENDRNSYEQGELTNAANKLAADMQKYQAGPARATAAQKDVANIGDGTAAWPLVSAALGDDAAQGTPVYNLFHDANGNVVAKNPWEDAKIPIVATHDQNVDANAANRTRNQSDQFKQRMAQTQSQFSVRDKERQTALAQGQARIDMSNSHYNGNMLFKQGAEAWKESNGAGGVGQSIYGSPWGAKVYDKAVADRTTLQEKINAIESNKFTFDPTDAQYLGLVAQEKALNDQIDRMNTTSPKSAARAATGKPQAGAATSVRLGAQGKAFLGDGGLVTVVLPTGRQQKFPVATWNTSEMAKKYGTF